jgi:hypothetical protein
VSLIEKGLSSFFVFHFWIADNATLEQESKELTLSIKNKTYRLKQLEGQAEEVSGFFLNPLDKQDKQFFNQT